MTTETYEHHPEPGTVQLIPTSIKLVYSRPAGLECLTLHLNDPQLGSFAVLLEPAAADHLSRALTAMGHHLPQLREDYDARFGGPR